ncbi:uncharacterized protein LOC122249982 [Penaeus japonicus]|uniref:uncharacterized protein LOC122249982 n=1 Tax=Penaeus japonicus TaxID=27405 RepID=UPI001C7126FD|nr:uncharacterized protein LOC122249982 [Penaeus japonicus]
MSEEERPQSPNAQEVVGPMNVRVNIGPPRVSGIKREGLEENTFAKVDDPLLCRFDILETHLGSVVEELRNFSTQLVRTQAMERDNQSVMNRTTPFADSQVAEQQERTLKKTYNNVNSITKGTSKRSRETYEDSETKAEESDSENDTTDDDDDDIRNLTLKRRRKDGGKASKQYRHSEMEAMKLVEHEWPVLESEGTEQYWFFMSQYKERTKGLSSRTKLRFGDVTEYIEKQTEKLLNWPHVKRHDLEGLTELYDFVESITSFTSSFDRLQEIDIPFYITQLTRSLDDTRIDRWNNIKPKAGKKRRDILELRDFLRKEVENLARSAKRATSQEIPKESQKPPDSIGKITRRDRKTEFEFKTHTRPSTSRPSTCELCFGKHSLPFCDLFKSASVRHRKKIALGHRKCFNCLKSGHIARQCRARPCDINGCGEPHSRLLHINNEENKRENHWKAQQQRRKSND